LDDFKESTDLLSGDNAFNSEFGKNFEFVINGKDKSRNELVFKGIRCTEGNCPDPDDNDDDELELEFRYWSKQEDWGENGAVPQEGDTVEIKPTWNMVLDISTPALTKLVINGRLTFQDDKDITLRAKQVWVQSGELIIGSPEAPF
jgi:hypothetical protein